MSAYCDIDMPEFYAETFPVARKQHWCCECSAPIEIGETHLYARGKNEGHFWRERQHMVCRELCMLIAKEDGCICFGELKEYVSNGDADWQWNRALKEQRRLWAAIIRRERNARRDTR